MGFYVGIDLGTTNSTVSVIRTEEYEDNPLDSLTTCPIYQYDERLHYLTDEICLPSALYFDIENRKVYTGRYAKSMYASGDRPLQTARSIKTRMSGESELRIPGINDGSISESFSMVQCASFFIRTILQSLKEQYPDEDVAREVVVTVPAAFSDDERIATKNAVLLGGFRSCRILDEPTAALLSYLNSDAVNEEVEEKDSARRLVYDIGGGTLDVSIAQASLNDEDDYDVNVLGLSNRMNLGGDDFDQLLGASFLEEFERTTAPLDSYSAEDQNRIIARIVSNAEDYKIKLNDKVLGCDPRRLARLPPLRVSFNLINSLYVTGQTLSKTKFDDICQVYTNPASGLLLKPVKSALKQADLTAGDIDEVILTGGMSHFYSIKDVLRGFFGETVPLSFVEDTRTSVSRGAAIYHWSLGENNYCASVKRLSNISKRLAGNIYIRRADGFDLLIDGKKDKTSGDFSYRMADSFMTNIPLFLYSGSIEDGADTLTALAGKHLELQHAYKEGEEIPLHWSIDENKVITINLMEKGYESVTVSRQLTPEKIQNDPVQKYAVNK